MPINGSLEIAAVHEAGHLIIALHHHLEFGDLRSENGFPAIKDFDLNQNSDHVAQFLVAGIAAEHIRFKHHDDVGATSDLFMLRSLASKKTLPSEALLLKQATEILQSHMNALERLRDKILNECRDSAFDFSQEPLLLDKDSIQTIWDESVER